MAYVDTKSVKYEPNMRERVAYLRVWLPVVEAEVLSRSGGGFFLKIRYRSLGFWHEKWITGDRAVKIDTSQEEIRQLERMMAQ